MANTPISGLPAGGAITDTNLFADVQAVGVGPTKVTALQIKQYVGNNLTLTGTPILPQTFTIGTVSYTWPAANGTAGSVLTNNGAGGLSWTTTSLGTVTSVGLDASPVGLIVANSPITSSGNLVITGGVLNVANGGTGASTPGNALINLLPATSPATAGYALCNDGTGLFYWAATGGGGGGGGVTTFSGGTTGLQPAAPSSGNITLTGTLAVANGGTGQTTILGARNAILPAQGGNAGKVLSTDGTNASWIPVAGTGTVTSVSGSGGTTGMTLTGGPITAVGTLTLGGTLGTANGGTGLTALGAGVQTALGLGVNTNGGFLLAGTGGILPVARGGTGTATVPANGQLLIGNGTGYTVASLTAGANITITPSAGGLTIAATGGGGGGVTQVTTTLSGLTVATNTTTPVIQGTLGHLSGGTGKTAVPTNGQLLIGNGAGYTLATLTAGTGVTIDNSVAGAITISATGTAGVSTFSGGSTGLLPAVATAGAITLSGTLAIANGGTGLSTIGASGTTLVSNGTALAYGNPNAATNVLNGTLGQVLYQSAPNVTAFAGPGAAGTYLAGNGVAAPTFKAATLTLGSTVLNLNTTTTALTGMTGINMAAAYNPTVNQDVATKYYVDNITSPINRIAPVVAATTGPITLSGAQSIDTVGVTAGQRVLVKDQAAAQDNGVYIVGTPWTRATDLDQPAEFTSASVFVTGGSANINTSWIQTATIVTVGTTAQVWLQQSGLYNYLAGTGITLSPANTINNDGVLTWSGGTTGLTPAVATKGAVTLAGTLLIANGGTSATTAQGARTNLLPSQAGNNGKFLKTDGTDVSWAATTGGAVYYIPLTAGGSLATAILGAGITDSVGNSYVLYNGTAANIAMTATSFPNFASFTDCTATSITVAAGKTMVVTTTSIVSSGTYAIDASNYLTGGVFVASVTGSSTMATILTGLSVIDNEGNVYVITNTGASSATISGLTVDNADAFPGYTTAASFVIPSKGTATIVSTVATTNFVVESISNSVSTNLSGGAANKIPYQTATDTTAFLPTGTAGQFLASGGAGSVPVWTTVPKVGCYYADITAGDTVQNILGAAPNGEVQYSEYTLYNSGTSSIAVTNTSGWLNGASWPLNVNGNNLNIAAKQSVTISVKTVGSVYAVVASSTSSATSSAITATADGTITAALTAASITENPGMLVTIRNNAAASANISLTATTITNYQPWAPAANATTIIVQNGECVTLRVVTPGSAYDVVNLTTQNLALNKTADYTLSNAYGSAGGLLVGNLLTITNTSSPAANIKLTADSFENYATWPVQCTSTEFTLPSNGTVTLELNSASASNWKIVSFEYPGLQAGAVAFAASVATYAYTSPGYKNVTGYTERFDPQSYFDATTGVYTPKVAGYYQLNVVALLKFGNTLFDIKLLKNGTTDIGTPTFDISGGSNWSTSNISNIEYFNGTTDSVVVQMSAAASSNATVDFSGSLVTQQNIINTASGTYRVPISASTTVSAALAAVTPTAITDVVNNLYIFTNTGSANVTLTTTTFIGWEAYPSQATATSVVLTPGSVLEIQTTTVGTGYQIVILNTPINVGSVAFSGYCNFNAPANAQTTVTSYVVNTNPQNYFNPTTGRFTPKVAGYYQFNLVASGQAGGFVGAAIIKNGSITASPWCYNDTGGGNFSSVTPSCTTYMNGTTDYVEAKVTPGSIGKTILTVLDGFLTNQTLTTVVGTTAAGRVSQSAAVTLLQSTSTKFTYNTVDSDPQSWWNAANNRFIPTIPGYYRATANICIPSTGASNYVQLTVAKNGATVFQDLAYSDAPGAATANGIIYMNGTTDYLEAYYYATAAGVATYNSNAYNNFQIDLVGANQAVPAVPATKFVTARANGSAGDYCVVQLDNLKIGFKGTGGAQMWMSTVSGTAVVYGEITTSWYGGGGGAIGISNASNQNPRNLTTSADYFISSGSSGQVNVIMTDDTSGNSYRATWIVGYSYANCQTFLERLN